ncbi:MAG: ABC transporter permease [Rhizobiales bacterium]|nr:ABC transporter permease [Hyphomicrobiales bacterium]
MANVATQSRTEAGAKRPEGAAARSFRQFREVVGGNPSFAFGYLFLAALIILSILVPWISPYEPTTADPAAYLQPPSAAHWLGTDNTGMDILTRILYAPRVDLVIALVGTLASALIGAPLGAVVGYYERRGGGRRVLSTVVMRAADVLQAFPVFVFAIALVAVFGQSIASIVLAIAFVNVPIYLRLMRTQVLTVSSMRYVEAAYIAGASDFAIIRRHIIPNSIAVALAQLSVNVGWAVLLTAALSFVGAGVVAPTPEWGSMIAAGFQNIVTGQWWPSVFPGMALALTVFAFGLVGASIETLADPRQRGIAGASAKAGH